MQLVLNIPDKARNKALPLIEFLKSLEFLTIEQNTEDFEVPEWHKEIVTQRMRTATPESFKPWSQVKKQLKHKK